MVFNKGLSRLRPAAEEGPHDLYTLPRREFSADLFTWITIGLGIAIFYLFYFEAPFLTGAKILLGCLSFGLLGGMLCYLDMEKRLMEHLKKARSGPALSPKKILSVSRKMLFFIVTVLILMVTVTLLMVFMDINYLLTHKDTMGPDIYLGVFKDILFV